MLAAVLGPEEMQDSAWGAAGAMSCVREALEVLAPHSWVPALSMSTSSPASVTE
jgi:hypothetical protein